MVPHSVFAQGPPSRGFWRAGAVVWRALDGIPAGDNTSSVPQYQPFQRFNPAPPGAPLGWMCTQGGQPGTWANVSTPLVATAEPQAVSEAGVGGGEGEVAELRAEVKELREAVRALAARDAGRSI